VDWLGAALVTAALMTAIYAIVQAGSLGWTSGRVLEFGALAAALMAAFVVLERRIAHPIMPLRILRVPGLASSSLVRGFLVTGMYSTFFLGTLYLEHIRHFTALETGLAFLPWTLTVAALSLGLTARLVARFGEVPMLVGGMLVAAAGLALLATVGPQTAFFPTIFVAHFALGLGIGCAFTPLLAIAMVHIPPADAGLGSGIVNVSQQLSGALGLAVLGTIATNRTHALLESGHPATGSLLSGYHLAFTIGAASVLTGALLALILLRPRPTREPELATESFATQGAA
jgi:MFS family permease